MQRGGTFPGTQTRLRYVQTALPGCNKDVLHDWLLSLLGTKMALQAAAKRLSRGENTASPLVRVRDRPCPCSGKKEVNIGVQGLEKGL